MEELVEKEGMELESKDVGELELRVFNTKNDTLKATLLYFGSFLFAISLYILLHEAGHAIALLIKGHPGVRIQANPFFGLTWYEEPIAAEDELFISLAGPVFPIIVVTVITIIVWFFKNQYLLPLLMVSGVAYMAEALNGFSVFFTYKFDNRSDYKLLLDMGVHPSILAIIFTLMILISFFLLWMTWPLLNISKEDKFFRVLLIHSAYILHTLLILIVSTILYSGVNPDFLIIVSIGAVIQLIFLVVRILLYRKIQPLIERIYRRELKEHKWSVVGSAIGFAVILVVAELIFFR